MRKRRFGQVQASAESDAGFHPNEKMDALLAHPSFLNRVVADRYGW
jgi:hypothetical protein